MTRLERVIGINVILRAMTRSSRAMTVGERQWYRLLVIWPTAKTRRNDIAYDAKSTRSADSDRGLPRMPVWI
jgi:hypothetical protein